MWIYVDFQHVANMITEEMESVCVWVSVCIISNGFPLFFRTSKSILNIVYHALTPHNAPTRDIYII